MYSAKFYGGPYHGRLYVMPEDQPGKVFTVEMFDGNTMDYAIYLHAGTLNKNRAKPVEMYDFHCLASRKPYEWPLP